MTWGKKRRAIRDTESHQERKDTEARNLAASHAAWQFTGSILGVPDIRLSEFADVMQDAESEIPLRPYGAGIGRLVATMSRESERLKEDV